MILAIVSPTFLAMALMSRSLRTPASARAFLLLELHARAEHARVAGHVNIVAYFTGHDFTSSSVERSISTGKGS